LSLTFAARVRKTFFSYGSRAAMSRPIVSDSPSVDRPSHGYRSTPVEATILDCEVRATRFKPLHLAIALGGTDLGKSGIGTYVRELLPPLIARVSADGGIVTAFGHASELKAYAAALQGAHVRRLVGVPARPGLNALWHLLRADAFAARVRADVLLLPAANRRISIRSRVPTVAVVHDLAQLRVAQKYDPLRMAYFRHVLLRAFRQPTRVVAVSRATRDDLERTIGLSGDRLRVVYNGVNTEQFTCLDANSDAVRSARRSAQLEEKPYLLYAARLEHPGKNHVRLLRAFARSGLSATHTLALSGGDWGAAALIDATVHELRLEASVRRLGFVATDQLPLLVAGADAVLMLGLHEGFGLPALEGLSAGRPVCVSSTGALPEVVGALGVQCDPLDEQSIADGLSQVVRNPAVRAQCEQLGPAWAERFTWSRTASTLLEVCHEAVA
jgi:glycosyltransferase involved in cell wall biosynthesis